jgi:hypothetical protein
MVAALADLGTAAPLEGLVDDQDQALVEADQGVADQAQEDAAELQGGPDGTVEDLVKAAEVGVLTASRDPECGGDGPPSACQEGAEDEDQDLLPSRLSEGDAKRGEDG